MPRTWLIVDCKALAYRSFFANAGMANGVVFGFLTELPKLEERFGTRHFVFCFDSAESLRKEKYPWYKESRADDGRITPDDRRRVAGGCDDLRLDVLPTLGYRNVFHQDGYEADDLIASVVRTLGGRENAVVVSSDSDLYQLLGPGVSVYRHAAKELMTEATFAQTWRLSPADWPTVQAIAGGKNDLPGAAGVGPVRAAQFVRDKTPPGQYLRTILEWTASGEFSDNLELCRLPYPGCAHYRPAVHPEPEADAWEAVCQTFNFPRDTAGPCGLVWDRTTVRTGIKR